MGFEIALTPAELDRLDNVNSVAQRDLTVKADGLDGLDRLAYLAGAAEAVNTEALRTIGELRAEGRGWTPITYALGHIKDPDNEKSRAAAVRRIWKRYRNNAPTCITCGTSKSSL